MEKQCRKWEGTGLLLGFVMGRKSTKMKRENVTRRYPHDRSMYCQWWGPRFWGKVVEICN